MARRNHKHDLKEHNERRSCATRRFLKVFCLKEASHPHTFKKKKKKVLRNSSSGLVSLKRGN